MYKYTALLYSFFSISILNIFRSRPASDFGAFTTIIFTAFPPLPVFYISANIPRAISKTHKTKTRNPDGNTVPRRIPTAAAIAQTMYALPLFLHIYNTRLSKLSFASSYAKHNFGVLVLHITICPKVTKAHRLRSAYPQQRILPPLPTTNQHRPFSED